MHMSSFNFTVAQLYKSGEIFRIPICVLKTIGCDREREEHPPEKAIATTQTLTLNRKKQSKRDEKEKKKLLSALYLRDTQK